MSLIHPTTESFAYAINGIKLALKNEPNFRVHVFIAILAMLLAFLLNFNFIEFALLTLTIGFVLIMELVNTTMEALVDIVSPNIRDKAKIAKDVSAAAVLLSAILALIIGILLYLPKIATLVFFISQIAL